MSDESRVVGGDTATGPEAIADHAGETPSFLWRVLGAPAAGAALSVCFPPVGFAVLLPFAASAFLLLLRDATVRRAAYLGIACGLVFYGASLFWMTRLFGMAAVSLWAILAAFVALFGALLAWMHRRLPGIPLWILAPLLWTGIEVYRSEIFVLNFGWMGLGYALANAPALSAIASWFGCYGLTFLVVLIGAILSRWAGGSVRIRTAGAVLSALWIVLCFAPIRTPAPSRPLNVRLVQANSEDEEGLFGGTRRPWAVPPDTIVWPEYSFVTDPRQTRGLWSKLERVPQENHCFFLFGAKDQFDPDRPAGFRNTAFLLDPSGEPVGTHVKNHPVHFIQDGLPGRESRAIPTALGRIGVSICFDNDYPDVARRLAEDGAEVFLVPNDDTTEWGPMQRAQHRLMFQMRAAECGRWLARADVGGGTSIAAPNGQETAHVDTTEPTVLDGVVGRETRKTVFVRGGWRFGQACLAAAFALFLWALVPDAYRRNRRG